MSTNQATEVRWAVVFERWSKKSLWDAFRDRDRWWQVIASSWSQVFDDCHDTVNASLTVDSMGDLIDACRLIEPHTKNGDIVTLMVEADFGVAKMNANLTVADAGYCESSASIFLEPSHDANRDAFAIVCDIEQGLRKLHHLAIVRTNDGQELRRKTP
jgi:hypothetical protein